MCDVLSKEGNPVYYVFFQITLEYYTHFQIHILIRKLTGGNAFREE